VPMATAAPIKPARWTFRLGLGCWSSVMSVSRFGGSIG
jgi:hypothetical protein